MEERVPVALVIREVTTEGASAIRRDMEGLAWGGELWEWLHESDELWLRAEGQPALELDDIGSVLFELSTLVWDSTGHYCDVLLILRPGELDQHLYAAEERAFAEYLASRFEVGLLSEQDLRRCLEELSGDLDNADRRHIRKVWKIATGSRASW